MNILALDQATACGWAAYYNEDIYSGVQNFALKRGESSGLKYLRFGAWLHEMSNTIGKIDIVIYEQPHFRGGAAATTGVGLTIKIDEFAAKHGCETCPVHGSRLKKWLTGVGNASKEKVMEEIKRRGFKPVDDNESDAIALLLYGLERFGIRR